MENSIQISSENFSILESQVRNRIQMISKDRSPTGSAIPKCTDLTKLEYDGCTFSKKYLDLVTLILLCWYSDTFEGFEQYILYEVRDYLERNLLFPELTAMSSVKEASLLIIMNFSDKVKSERILFGTILDPTRVEEVIRRVRLRMVHPHKPKRLIRHRGYRDHGSLRPSDRWIESSDWSFTEEQNLLERKRNEYSDLVALIVHQAGDWLLKNHFNFEK